MEPFFQALVVRLRETFDPQSAGRTAAELVSDLLVGVAVLVMFVIIWKVLRALLVRVLKRTKIDDTAYAFAVTTLKFTTVIFGILFSLDAMGVDTNKMFASLGLAGLTMGFAARDALSNVISGILIFWDRPFVIGDLIEIDGKYGRVEAITLRSTRVVTVDGRMLAVPNTNVIGSTVASYTNFPKLRLDIAVGIAVDEDIGRVRRLLLDLIQGQEAFVSKPAPRVVVTRLGDYSNEIELQAWIHDERRHVEERFKLRESVYSTLREAGVDMPYETLSIEPLDIRHLDDLGGGRPDEANTKSA